MGDQGRILTPGYTHREEPSNKPVAAANSAHLSVINCDEDNEGSKVVQQAAPELKTDATASSHRIKAEGTRERGHRINVLRIWFLELGACCLYITAVVAIIATLAPLHGKPRPKWPFRISINSLISAYTVIMKTSVLYVISQGLGQMKWNWFGSRHPLRDLVDYDDASRGPLGAIMLLSRVHRHHLLASFGALITIVMTIIDPLTQLLVRYDDCVVPMEASQATIPRTHFHGYSYITGGSNFLHPDVVAAMNSGLYSQGAVLDFSCTSGNCTFPQEYSTVGYCSMCQDVSHDLTFTNFTLTDSTGSNPFWNVTLPSGLCLTVEVGRSTSGVGPSSDYAKMDGATGEFIFAMNGPDQIAFDPSTYQPQYGCNSNAEKDTWRCKGYGASTCQFYPCVRTLNATVDTGQIQEREVGRTSRTDLAKEIYQDVLVWGAVDYQCLTAEERQIVGHRVYNQSDDTYWEVEAHTRWIPFNLTAQPFYNVSDVNATCLYLINDLTDLYVQVYQSIVMGGTVHFTLNVDVPFADGSSEGFQTYQGPQALQTIFDFANVTFDHMDRTYANMSDSLTTWMRQTGEDSYSAPAVGVVNINQTCLGVRWGWLALPSALAVLTLAYFILMMISTHASGDDNERASRIWKSSPLALLFHGLQHQPHWEKDYDVEKMRGMQALAEREAVKLNISDEGITKLLVDDEDDQTRRNSRRRPAST